MINKEIEIWKSHPDIDKLEVSTFGRVRTLDRVVKCGENRTRLAKGRVLKQRNAGNGYMILNISINGKQATKLVHRLVAQTFIPNPDNLPDVNHKNCVRDDNRVGNLEWCSRSYNIGYREKYGISNTETEGHPLFAVNLSTLKVLRFRSQGEASLKLEVDRPSINMVIRGKRKQAGGYWFKEDDGNGIEIDKDKLNDIADSMPFTGGVFAVNLNKLEVSRFKSQSEAGMVLGIGNRSISAVIKVRRNQTHGFWFVNDDNNAANNIKQKLHEIKYRAVN